jgi:predicted dehydrogenase
MKKIGIIGCGHWGRNYIRILRELKQYIVMCCDTNENSLSWVKETYPFVAVTKSVNDVVSAPDMDAVIISTPSVTHYEIARKCLENGKDVLLEKPFVTRADDGERLIALANENKRVLMVSHTFLYNPAVRKMKEFIKEDDFGKIYYLHATRTHLGLIRADVSAVWDLAPHDISIFSYLLDSAPTTVSAVGGRFLSKDKDDAAFISLKYPNGIIGNIHVSWADSNKERRVVAVGSRKRIVFNDLDNLERLKIFEKGVAVERPISSFGEFQYLLRDGDIISPKVDLGEPLKIECQHFIDCIKNRTSPFTDGKQGVSVVRVIDAVDESMRNNGTPVEIGA